MAGRRIAIVGGGSVMWTPIILANLAANERLGGSHIVLHDIDPGALALTYRFALAHQRRTASALTFSQTTDQAEALEGADFVIVTISTGGLEAMRPDLEIPERYGIFQTVGDTVGPGAFPARFAISRSSSLWRKQWKSAAPTRGFSMSRIRFPH